MSSSLLLLLFLAPHALAQTRATDANFGAPANLTTDSASANCSFYSSAGYSCVAFDLCEDGEIITDGGSLIDVRIGGQNGQNGPGGQAVLDPERSKCPGALEVCCRRPDFAGRPISQETKTSKPSPYMSKCGRRNRDGAGVRILTTSPMSSSTQFGEWPNMCAVLQKKKIAGKELSLYVCGASLVADDIVVTAAHCVGHPYNASSFKVRCGEWDSQQTTEPLAHQDRDVVGVSRHPAFDNGSLANDLALLHVGSPFNLTDHVDVACLPLPEFSSFDDKACVATGWGKDEFGIAGKYQVLLKQVQLDLVHPAECAKELQATKLGVNFRLDESFVCAGGLKGVDTCKGDGGGPLLCPINNGTAYVQTGVVSWGVSCGQTGVPGVYASVSHGLCFIDWAARCYLGRDRFGIKECQNWFRDQLQSFRTQRMEFRSQLEATQGKRERLRIRKRLERANDVLKNLKKASSECKDSLIAGDDMAVDYDADLADLLHSLGDQ